MSHAVIVGRSTFVVALPPGRLFPASGLLCLPAVIYLRPPFVPPVTDHDSTKGSPT